MGEQLGYPVGEQLGCPVGEQLGYPVGEQLGYPVVSLLGSFAVKESHAICPKHCGGLLGDSWRFSVEERAGGESVIGLTPHQPKGI